MHVRHCTRVPTLAGLTLPCSTVRDTRLKPQGRLLLPKSNLVADVVLDDAAPRLLAAAAVGAHLEQAFRSLYCASIII